jgi:hypothetical protein
VGKVPVGTALVLVLATQAEQAMIANMIKALTNLINLKGDSSIDDIQAVLADLQVRFERADSYFENYGANVDYTLLKSTYEKVPRDLDVVSVLDPLLEVRMTEVLDEFKAQRAKPVVVAASTNLSPTTVGELEARNFEELSNPLADNSIYDLVATAYLNDGTQVSSKSVRFTVSKSSTIAKPIPRTLGGEEITEEYLSLLDRWVGRAFAQEGAVSQLGGQAGGTQTAGQTAEATRSLLEIKDTRPVVTGDTEFGSQVFAIWNSVVLQSSVISDSEQGAFEIQAPQHLEIDVPHRVTLYAVKTEEGSKIRSESVDVHFRIRTGEIDYRPLMIAAAAVVVAGILALMILHRMRAQADIRLLTLSQHVSRLRKKKK